MCSIPWSLEADAGIKHLFSLEILAFPEEGLRQGKSSLKKKPSLLQFYTKGLKGLRGNWSLKNNKMAFSLCKLFEGEYHKSPSNLLM